MAKEEETVEEVVENTEGEIENTEEDDNWAKMKSLVSDTIDERLEAWQAKQSPKKTTSSNSPRKQAAKPPKRKQGFLTGGFFSGLSGEEE